MKKILYAGFTLFFTSLCFALPNIRLYENAEFMYHILNDAVYDADNEIVFEIQDTKLYYAEKHEYAGTITESDDILVIEIYFEARKAEHAEYSKFTGFLLFRQSYWFGRYCISEFDEKTGLQKKFAYYTDNGKLGSYELYEYEKGRLAKTSYYNIDDSSNGFTQFSYDKKTGRKNKESRFDADSRLVQITEYNPATDRRTKKYEYNADGFLAKQTVYDKDSGDAVERLVYTPSSKKPVKWTFLKFDDDGRYALSDGMYLNSELCWYSDLKNFSEESKEAPIEWNEHYSAIVRKYDFNEKTAGYTYIQQLKNSRHLTVRPFALCNKNSNVYYCFTSTDDDEIDISSCYEIELIKKQKNYPAMNRSGTGKGPFGFDIGMTYEEVKVACNGNEPEHIADDRYYVKPNKSHPLFEKYIVWISEAVGLYYVKGISSDIASSDYGTEAKRQFSNLLLPLEKKYGKFSLTDTIKSDYYWKGDKGWMKALKDGARTYRADWTVNKENYKDFDGLYGIITGINAATYSTAYIWIEYEFQNYDDARESLNDVL